MLKKPFSPVSRLHGHDKHAACSARTAPGPAAAAPAGTNGSGREKGGRDGAAPRSLPAPSGTGRPGAPAAHRLRRRGRSAGPRAEPPPVRRFYGRPRVARARRHCFRVPTAVATARATAA